VSLNFRLGAALGATACFLLLAYGYYLQYARGLDPCPLCLVQRGFYYLVGGVLVVAAIHAPLGIGRMAYGGLAALFAAGGIATAGRQVWLQHLPPERVPACGPDLFFMLNNFPLWQALGKLFAGTGECAVVDWTFLGLSIAEWSLGWFAALFLYALWLASRGRRSRSAASASAA
jgi:protein dithiol:quinone oxidoreductase